MISDYDNLAAKDKYIFNFTYTIPGQNRGSRSIWQDEAQIETW